MEYVARQSGHIEEDIKRNWSSWMFGSDGFDGTRDQLQECLDKITDSSPFYISGFDIFPDQLKNFEFGELYENYWVVIDRVNARHGLSCRPLNAENLQNAIIESKTEMHKYSGEGWSFDAREWKLVHSEDDIHIFESI